MSDDWDFYACRVDDEPASIFVDLGIAKDVPLQGLAHMAYVRVYMRAPREDGLSSQEEFDELLRLEDKLTTALTAESLTTFVGRNTSGGCRDFYFYTADPADWQSRVSKALVDFSHYEHKAGARPDDEWRTYREFLYPSPETMEHIQNRRVCEALQRDGDALTEPREIDHWAYFPDEESRARFLEAISSQGFTVKELTHVDRDDMPYGVQLVRVDVPSLDGIDDVTMPLHRAAAEAGGDYDGWGTSAISG